MTLSKPSEFWDKASTTKTFTHPLDICRLRSAYTINATILDYGCGYGRLGVELAHNNFLNVTGVDSSREMILLARERCPELRFLQVNEGEMPFADSHFDVVLLFAVLTCIPDTGRQQALISEVHRVLQPGGTLIISDYPLQTDARNLDRYERSSDEFEDFGTFHLPDGVIVRHHSEQHFSRLLSEFSSVDTVTQKAVTMNGNPTQIVQLWATR